MANNFALSGLMFAGKDYVAERAGLIPISIAEPMYAICEVFHGYCNKKEETHRKFLQEVGHWGWAGQRMAMNPRDVKRYRRFKAWVDEEARDALPEWADVEWERFGEVKTFWVDILFQRWHDRVAAGGCAVVNCRHEHEAEVFERHGWGHYLIACSDETRRARAGGPIPKSVDGDQTERYARQLFDAMPGCKVVWNDEREPPKGREFLTIGDFVKKSIPF